MTDYVVLVKADQNDADYVSQTNVVDFDAKVFDDWFEPYDQIQVTYREFITALGQAFQELNDKYKNINNFYNWRDTPHNSYKNEILEYTLKLLNIFNILSIQDLEEELFDFIPGTCDYPVHTILEIVAIPNTQAVTLFKRKR